MHNVIVRDATLADVPAIVRLWQELMGFHEARDPYFAIRDDAAGAFESFVRSMIDDVDATVAVAEHRDAVVGYCSANVDEAPPVFEVPRYGSVMDLAVTETVRRHAVGTALFTHVQAWFVTKGVHRIELRVASTNEVATSFWKKLGFAPFVQLMRRSV